MLRPRAPCDSRAGRVAVPSGRRGLDGVDRPAPRVRVAAPGGIGRRRRDRRSRRRRSGRLAARSAMARVDDERWADCWSRSVRAGSGPVPWRRNDARRGLVSAGPGPRPSAVLAADRLTWRRRYRISRHHQCGVTTRTPMTASAIHKPSDTLCIVSGRLMRSPAAQPASPASVDLPARKLPSQGRCRSWTRRIRSDVLTRIRCEITVVMPSSRIVTP